MVDAMGRTSRKRSFFSSENWNKGWEVTALYSVTAVLIVFGLITLYSASSYDAQTHQLPGTYYFSRQLIGVALGMVALMICSRVNYHMWRKLAWPILAVTWVLLIVLVLPGENTFAPQINGANRWIRVAGFTVQPSELAKLAIIIWTASLAVRKQNQFKSLKTGFLPFVVVWSAMMLPIALEPDLMTALLVGFLGCLVLFMAGGRVGHFIFAIVAGLPILWSELNGGYRLQRLKAFFDPSLDIAGVGYQVQQSLFAIGSGGVFGVGFEQGRQNLGFLPEAHNDFIFAMIGEEFGLLGIIFTVALYLGIIGLGFHIAAKASDLMGQLLATGISSLIASQAITHMLVGLGWFPNTGLALPFISYGRSNLLVSMACIGILVSIARPPRRVRRGRRRARA